MPRKLFALALAVATTSSSLSSGAAPPIFEFESKGLGNANSDGGVVAVRNSNANANANAIGVKGRHSKGFRLLDLASCSRTSHAMQSALRLSAAYGYFVECASPTAVHGFNPTAKLFNNSSNNDHDATSIHSQLKKDMNALEIAEAATSIVPGPPVLTEKAVTTCDTGGSVCHGVPCNFLVNLAEGPSVGCAHLASVWGCQGCLRCTGCQEQQKKQKAAGLALETDYVCPNCGTLGAPPTQLLLELEEVDSVNSVSSETDPNADSEAGIAKIAMQTYCSKRAEQWQSCAATQQAQGAQIAVIVDRLPGLGAEGDTERSDKTCGAPKKLQVG